MKPTISVIIPSRDRPRGLWSAIESIRATQGDYQVEIIVVLDEPDTESQELMAQRSDVVVVIGGPGEKFLGRPQDKYNLGYAQATGEWVITGSDDITFDAPGWLDECFKVNRGGMVGLSDGGQDPNWVCVLWMANRWYITNVMRGYFGLPWYNVWWADVEWCERARRIGLYAPCTKIKMTHHHWLRGKATQDKIYALAQTLVGEDEKTYTRRSREGFRNDQ